MDCWLPEMDPPFQESVRNLFSRRPESPSLDLNVTEDSHQEVTPLQIFAKGFLEPLNASRPPFQLCRSLVGLPHLEKTPTVDWWEPFLPMFSAKELEDDANSVEKAIVDVKRVGGECMEFCTRNFEAMLSRTGLSREFHEFLLSTKKYLTDRVSDVVSTVTTTIPPILERMRAVATWRREFVASLPQVFATTPSPGRTRSPMQRLLKLVDVFEIILGYLWSTDVIGRVMLTCKYFYRFVKERCSLHLVLNSEALRKYPLDRVLAQFRGRVLTMVIQNSVVTWKLPFELICCRRLLLIFKEKISHITVVKFHEYFTKTRLSIFKRQLKGLRLMFESRVSAPLVRRLWFPIMPAGSFSSVTSFGFNFYTSFVVGGATNLTLVFDFLELFGHQLKVLAIAYSKEEFRFERIEELVALEEKIQREVPGLFAQLCRLIVQKCHNVEKLHFPIFPHLYMDNPLIVSNPAKPFDYFLLRRSLRFTYHGFEHSEFMAGFGAALLEESRVAHSTVVEKVAFFLLSAHADAFHHMTQVEGLKLAVTCAVSDEEIGPIMRQVPFREVAIHSLDFRVRVHSRTLRYIAPFFRVSQSLRAFELRIVEYDSMPLSLIHKLFELAKVSRQLESLVVHVELCVCVYTRFVTMLIKLLNFHHPSLRKIVFKEAERKRITDEDFLKIVIGYNYRRATSSKVEQLFEAIRANALIEIVSLCDSVWQLRIDEILYEKRNSMRAKKKKQDSGIGIESGGGRRRKRRRLR